MVRKTTIVLLLGFFVAGNVWAGSSVLKRAQERMRANAQYSKALFMEQTVASQIPAQTYQGPKFFQKGALRTSQIDDVPNNTLVWGIYGPGRNLVRDPETGRLTAAWARTPSTGTKPRTIFSANSENAGESWVVAGPLDNQTASRGYYSNIFRAGSDAGVTEWVVWSERDEFSVDITHDLVPGLLLFDTPRGIIKRGDVPDPALEMVFTFAGAAPNTSGSWNIYVAEYQTTGTDSTTQDNVLWVKSTDSGVNWSTPRYIFGNEAGQVPLRYGAAQTGYNFGNYCSLAFAIDPNNANHIGALFISSWIENFNTTSVDTLLQPFGLNDSNWHYYFVESNDGGDSWSTPEMLLGRDPLARQQWEFTVGIDTTGDGQSDVSNPGYLYGGAFFWAFLYEPVFTGDGSFHAAIMPTLAEVVPEGGVGVGIGSDYDIAVYARRSSAGEWFYVTDLAGTTVAFDSTGEVVDPRVGQTWFAEMSKSADDKIGISWSSRLQAYATGNEVARNGFPIKGPLVVAGSPDGGNSWTEAQAFFPDPLPAGTAEDGAWPGSSVGNLIIQDATNPNVYNFEFVFQGLGADNVTLWNVGGIGIWYTNDPSVDMSTATPRTGVKDRTPSVPLAYRLGQNYPNPFNPSTAIEYSVPVASNVKLAVYNSIGQEIATLVNGRVAAGNHTAVWNAKSVPSGVYFYKLEAENFSQTKKMVLTK